MNECYKCGFWNSDYEACSCPHSDKWYACPIDSERPENKQMFEEWMKWLTREDDEQQID